jgi:hypothetical protein
MGVCVAPPAATVLADAGVPEAFAFTHATGTPRYIDTPCAYSIVSEWRRANRNYARPRCDKAKGRPTLPYPSQPLSARGSRLSSGQPPVAASPPFPQSDDGESVPGSSSTENITYCHSEVINVSSTSSGRPYLRKWWPSIASSGE